MKMARKCVCNANKEIAQIMIINQIQRKQEIVVTLSVCLFVQVTETLSR